MSFHTTKRRLQRKRKSARLKAWQDMRNKRIYEAGKEWEAGVRSRLFTMLKDDPGFTSQTSCGIPLDSTPTLTEWILRDAKS